MYVCTYVIYQVSELLSAALAQAIVSQDKTIELRRMKSTIKKSVSCIYDEVSEILSLDAISYDGVFGDTINILNLADYK